MLKTSLIGKKLNTFFNRKLLLDKIYNEYVSQNILDFGHHFTYKSIDRGLIESLGPRRDKHEERPKSGIPDGYVAIIGCTSNSTTETAPGRHLIGQQRWPLPDPGHFFTWCARLWLFNSRRVPDSHAPYSITATNTWALRPTAHTRANPGSCSQLSTATASFQIDSLQGSRLLISLPLSLSHTHNQLNKSHTQPHSAHRL